MDTEALVYVDITGIPNLEDHPSTQCYTVDSCELPPHTHNFDV